MFMTHYYVFLVSNLYIFNSCHIVLTPYYLLHIFNTNHVFQYINMYLKQVFSLLKNSSLIELSEKGTP
jgi:hypothetical protein